MEDVVLVVEPCNREAIHIEGIEVEWLLLAQRARRPASGRSEVWLSNVAALGEDLHHTVVGARPVERGGSGAANDLDVLDIGWIEIGEAVLWIGPGSEVGQLSGFVVDDDAVDDVQRIGSGDE